MSKNGHKPWQWYKKIKVVRLFKHHYRIPERNVKTLPITPTSTKAHDKR